MKFLIAYILLEVAGFALVGKLCGVLITLALVVLTTFLGFWILRRSGMNNAMQLMQQMQQTGQMPPNMPNGFHMIAGFLLILPGFFTDILGLLILIPWVQKWVATWLVKKGVVPPMPAHFESSAQTGRVIEGEVLDRDKK